MTVPALAPAPGPDAGPGDGSDHRAAICWPRSWSCRKPAASPGWEAQLAATGHCTHPIRLQGRIDATDRATGADPARL